MAMIRKIPDKIAAKLKKINTPSITVACGMHISKDELANNNFKRLGIIPVNGSLRIPSSPIFPPSESGCVSDENINGIEIIHKDKPKIKKDIYLGDRPIYGDWTNGTFSLWQRRDVYQRSFIQPRGYSISIQEQDSPVDGYHKIIFTVIPQLLRSDKSFEDDLLFALSFLRENTGVYDIFASDAKPEDIIKTRKVLWEIFPPGQRDFHTELARRLNTGDPKKKTQVLARADKIDALQPQQYVLGAGLNSNYYGALFFDDLVVFENLEYGNATYVLYNDWEQLSQRSRTEILNSGSEYDRLIHDGSWDDHLTELIKRQRQKRRWRRR